MLWWGKAWWRHPGCPGITFAPRGVVTDHIRGTYYVKMLINESFLRPAVFKYGFLGDVYGYTARNESGEQVAAWLSFVPRRALAGTVPCPTNGASRGGTIYGFLSFGTRRSPSGFISVGSCQSTLLEHWNRWSDVPTTARRWRRWRTRYESWSPTTCWECKCHSLAPRRPV